MSKIVVSDASPLNYLALIGDEALLPRLFSTVLIPPAVAAELSSKDTPAVVARLMSDPPPWLEIHAPKKILPALGLDAGETEAISLAVELGIGAILMDERKGRRLAAKSGLLTVGTLAILEESASRGWIDFEGHINRLRCTSFRIHEQLIAEATERLRTKRR